MATYCTRIYVKVADKALMEPLCNMDISDLGKGFYKAENIFHAGSAESYFYDGESGINEDDLLTLVERFVEVIGENGAILADTYSYDYDPNPQICYYTGNEIISKLLDVDGSEFAEEVNITDTAAWIQFVENAESLDEEFGFEDWGDEEDEED